jgi:hypothetical protein
MRRADNETAKAAPETTRAIIDTMVGASVIPSPPLDSASA